MSDEPKVPNPAQLLHDLRYSEDLRHRKIEETGLDPHLALLRHYQSERLVSTYADFLSDRRYREACLFFLSDIYAPRDFSQRNHDVERIHAFLSQVAPAHLIQILTDTVELNTLTDALDEQLLHVLVDELGMTDSLPPELYDQAYRLCDNYDERRHQIDLIAKLVEQVGKGAHLMIVGLALRLLKIPAQQAGWVELYDFLERGYQAFKQIRDVMKLVNAIRQRERQILDAIYAPQADG